MLFSDLSLPPLPPPDRETQRGEEASGIVTVAVAVSANVAGTAWAASGIESVAAASTFVVLIAVQAVAALGCLLGLKLAQPLHLSWPLGTSSSALR